MKLIIAHKIHTRFLHKITYLRKFKKSDILCIQTPLWGDEILPVSVCTSLGMDSALNRPADGALAQQCNASVYPTYGMSVSAFDPWWAVPI